MHDGGSPDDLKSYRAIVRHYETCLARHGDTHQGVDWPNAEDAETRYRVMLEMLASRPQASTPTLLDFGCGAGHLLEHLQRRGTAVQYRGADLSSDYVALCRRKFPGHEFLEVDLRHRPDGIPESDFVVANGVFTEKCTLSWEAMWEHTRIMIGLLFARARIGLAFNVMSDHVDWRRDDLFHLPFDVLAGFLKANVSRHYLFRSDYGLFEYTAYVFRDAA